MAVEKSGVHLTGVDSGWPVGGTAETPYRKDGTGADSNPKALSQAAGVVTDATSANEVQRLVQTGTSGTWRPHTAAPIVNNGDTAAAVQASLESIFGVGNVTVTRTGTGPWTYDVTFKGAQGDLDIANLAPVDVALLGTGHGIVQSTVTPGSP